MESICNNECEYERESECERAGCGCNECRESVTMNARVLRVCCCQLLVCDLCGCQEVLVHTSDACRFRVGQCVCITYSGVMTRSVPPQINAECVRPLNNCGNRNCCC